jgi:hypothetical protein
MQAAWNSRRCNGTCLSRSITSMFVLQQVKLQQWHACPRIAGRNSAMPAATVGIKLNHSRVYYAARSRSASQTISAFLVRCCMSTADTVDRKHKLKHEKPFKCDRPKCKRRDQGFTTVNDLDRHKKSVHRVGLLQKSYQCASESCRNKEKIWPRLDNFKQHIERMHKGEHMNDLVKR